MGKKRVPVRIIYADLSSELLSFDNETIIKAMSGISDKESIHLDGKEVVEIHIISHFSHSKFTKIAGSTADGFSLAILAKE